MYRMRLTELFGPGFCAVLAAACNAAPIELEFESTGTDNRREGDRVRDAAVNEPAVAPETTMEPVDGASGPRSLPFSPGPECDDFPASCADAERPKCTLISNEPGYRSSCVPLQGALATGASCQRRVRGDDDCAPGGFCTPIGRGFQSDNRMICRKLCKDAAECGEGQRCLRLLADGVRGLCVEPCTVFEDAGCGAEELRCAAAPEADGSFFGYCEIFGSLGQGEPCTLSSQCERGATCELSSTSCRLSCDDEHPCSRELRCVPLELGRPDSLRLCVP